MSHDHALSAAAFPDSEKTPAQTDGSCCCCRHRGELRCVTGSDLRFLRSGPVSSRCRSEAAGAGQPTPKAESDDKSRQFATVVVPATIQAFFVTDLYAKDSGYVSQVNNDIGDHVKKGQVLAVIEDPELQAQFDKAQAAVQQAKAALEVAKRQLAGMQADLTLQQVTLKRQKELFAGKAATAQTLDEAQAKQGVSSANVETGNAKITLAEADLQAAKAEAEQAPSAAAI